MQETLPLGFRVWVGVPGAMPVAHRHGDLEVNCLARGHMTYLLGGGLVEVPPRRMAVFWGAIPHQLLAVAGDTRCGWITIPLAWAFSWHLPRSLITDLLSGAMALEAESPADEIERMGIWERELAGGAAAWRELVILEVQARLKRFAMSRVAAARHQEQRPPALARIEAMAAYIADHHTRPLAVAEIARHAGLAPSHAMTAFRRGTGMTLNAYLTRYRVASAQRLLATTEMPVIEVALASGFGSQSRFFEAFAALCGLPPNRYRRQARETRA